MIKIRVLMILWKNISTAKVSYAKRHDYTVFYIILGDTMSNVYCEYNCWYYYSHVYGDCYPDIEIPKIFEVEL
jgi:hypothetical protein